ncbi:MAG TPA: hypothetical protein VFC63_11200 [Blastocatellia bacterium]|nr:hypothetical protein [Blastocatellia bacterium]
MTRVKLLILVCVVLFAALTFVSIQSFARSSKAKADTTAVAEPGARCPNIHKAVGALETAMHDMENASNNYCGHKADAMEATRRALEQLRAAENCADCR